MQSFFNADFFAGNRASLLALHNDKSPIIVTANGLLQRGADSTYPFSQDANFWYLTGINEPDIILVLCKDQEFIIVPPRSASREAFDGAVATKELSERSGITEVLDNTQGWDRLQRMIEISVATIAAAPSYIEQYGMYTNPARAQLIKQLQIHNADIEIVDVSMHLSRMRMIKQPPELEAIQAAIDITAAAIIVSTDKKNLAKLLFEYELEGHLTAGFRGFGASGHAFEPIVASGKRACTLHNVANNGPLDPNDLIVIDVGAEVEHYAADITRTIAMTEPSKRQREVYAAVLDVQEYAMSLLKPGVFIKVYEQQIEDYMGKKLIELGLIDTAEHNAIRMYYPHATSHFLGLNVHDTGDYSLPLAPGMVLTVEPGIYIPDENIGIRIEDDVVITDDGVKVLTQSLPRTLQ